MPPPKSKGGKMLSLINWRLKVTINDGRALTGQMLAFDRHMNLVLADCEEFRRVRTKKKDAGEVGSGQEQEIKRTLGLVILRGETVVSISVEGPPPVVDEDKKNALPVGPGRGMPAGRGMGMMPPIGQPPMRPPMGFPPGGMPGPPPGFRPPGFPPGMPFPPPGFTGAPPPGFQPPQ
ncbi:Sm-like ribonucleoprotein [Guyanagaster necrorhizus]|uniref:Sm protein B n=1 Tax=Guyanagaster necrorhizus TaxID=856835 RepID=A0A9P8AQB6_9AGAR|nr:Sm-like ribonucleoprotein [Guyanagaster necrorhizus MCA 3950]KAG7443676.1 Sm-like ribonucleoprotein [Guyanagaster necrorhizus MCA 3950]